LGVGSPNSSVVTIVVDNQVAIALDAELVLAIGRHQVLTLLNNLLGHHLGHFLLLHAHHAAHLLLLLHAHHATHLLLLHAHHLHDLHVIWLEVGPSELTVDVIEGHYWELGGSLYPLTLGVLELGMKHAILHP